MQLEWVLEGENIKIRETKYVFIWSISKSVTGIRFHNLWSDLLASVAQIEIPNLPGIGCCSSLDNLR